MPCLAAITRLQLAESLGHMPLLAAALPSTWTLNQDWNFCGEATSSLASSSMMLDTA